MATRTGKGDSHWRNGTNTTFTYSLGNYVQPVNHEYTERNTRNDVIIAWKKKSRHIHEVHGNGQIYHVREDGIHYQVNETPTILHWN
jgi:hypothetical protein